jgi:uncharacterized membrane protein YeaQ/YmgE (transglycosylase-associated protein family)
MGIIAWIFIGLTMSLLVNVLILGRRSRGLALACVIGVADALLGGWAATRLFRGPAPHGFFNPQTWVTAITASAVLLLVYSRPARGVRRADGAPVAAVIALRLDAAGLFFPVAATGAALHRINRITV